MVPKGPLVLGSILFLRSAGAAVKASEGTALPFCDRFAAALPLGYRATCRALNESRVGVLVRSSGHCAFQHAFASHLDGGDGGARLPVQWRRTPF